MQNSKNLLNISVAVNIILIIGIGFFITKYQVLLLPKNNLSPSLPRNASVSAPVSASENKTAVSSGIPKNVLVGRITELKDTSLRMELIGDDAKKTASLTLSETVQYFKLSLPNPQNSVPPKSESIQKNALKVGDFISAAFKDAVDVSSNAVLVPERINLLPPPPQVQK